MTPDELAQGFIEATLPEGEWTHRAHLIVGAWHVRRYGAEDALVRLRDGIRRLNDAHGTPNTESEGYHETVTRAYVALIADFLARQDDIDALVQSPIADKRILLEHYSRELLLSERARAEWVSPDRAPLPSVTSNNRR